MVRVASLMVLALLHERLGGAVETAEQAHEAWLVHSQHAQARGQRGGVRVFLRPKTTEAAAVVAGAKRVAARVRYGAEARCASRDHRAHDALALAVQTHAVLGDVGLFAVEQRRDQLEQLLFVDRTTAELEVYGHMRSDRRRGVEGVDVFGSRVHDAGELADVLEIPQGLDAAGGRAGAD